MQWIHRWLRRCQNRDRGCPEVTYSIGSAHSAKTDVEGLPYVGKLPLQLPMDSGEGSIVSPSLKIRICQLRGGRLQGDVLVNCV